MGRKSRGKEAARANRRPRADLLERLAESREFLARSSQSFDDGYEAEAKRLAVTLRVLLHETGASHSLLGLLGLDERLEFTDTALPIDPGNLLGSPGLVLMELTAGSGGRYVAPLGNLVPDRIKRPTPFTAWWRNAVMKEPHGTTWSRRDFVLDLANKEGGAHVDPTLDHEYERLVRHNGLGWTFGDDPADGGTPFEGNPVAASVRQIAYEVIDTLAGNEDLLV